MDRTGLKILENNKNIQSIISVNTNILLRRFRLTFLRIMCSTSCYKEHVNFENSLYTINSGATLDFYFGTGSNSSDLNEIFFICYK
jgi:hypothetical protein